MVMCDVAAELEALNLFRLASFPLAALVVFRAAKFVAVVFANERAKYAVLTSRLPLYDLDALPYSADGGANNGQVINDRGLAHAETEPSRL